MSEREPCEHPCIVWVGGQLPYCPACEQFIVEPVRVILTKEAGDEREG